MAINQTNTITWLVTVIRLAGKITFEELDWRWRETDMSRPADRPPHTLAPYAVKLYRQRWYVVALALEADKVLIFALDRIRSLTVTSRAFTHPADFFPDVYFRDSFGIFADDGSDPETVRLKVCASQADYLRDLPLHASQREVRRDEDYSLFEFRLRPTFDFTQEILWNGDTMEVLAPLWLRRQVAAKARRIWTLNKDRGTEEE